VPGNRLYTGLLRLRVPRRACGDLVLLDYHMPQMTEDAVAERMRASQPDIPLALLSADEALSLDAPGLRCARLVSTPFRLNSGRAWLGIAT
jgi:CheY-like chemotaxis protein